MEGQDEEEMEKEILPAAETLAKAKDVLDSLLLIENGEVVIRSRDELVFTYRNWQKEEDVVVLRASFVLEDGDGATIKETCREYLDERRTKQPVGQLSAGSFFKNPEEAPAGFLIEEAGLKGTRVGGALVSEAHANFIVNTGKATTADIINLMKKIRSKVREVHGVELEPEVKFLGIEPEVLIDGK